MATYLPNIIARRQLRLYANAGLPTYNVLRFPCLIRFRAKLQLCRDLRLQIASDFVGLRINERRPIYHLSASRQDLIRT